jgi:hypothetical protein
VSEIEFCTLYLVPEQWVVGCMLRFVHANNHFSDTLKTSPVGTAENAPGRQSWETLTLQSPANPGLPSWDILSRPYGTDPLSVANPGLTSWATLSRPYGTQFGEDNSRTHTLKSGLRPDYFAALVAVTPALRVFARSRMILATACSPIAVLIMVW